MVQHPPNYPPFLPNNIATPLAPPPPPPGFANAVMQQPLQQQAPVAQQLYNPPTNSGGFSNYSSNCRNRGRRQNSGNRNGRNNRGGPNNNNYPMQNGTFAQPYYPFQLQPQMQPNFQQQHLMPITRQMSGMQNLQRRNVSQYCWSHGACAHNGYQCETPLPGHVPYATFQNRFNGCNNFCF